MVEGIERFIRRELENGNRLDFGLVSFLPRLSAALPARDADPGETGIRLRGSVKARKSLSASLGLVRQVPFQRSSAGRQVHARSRYPGRKRSGLQAPHRPNARQGRGLNGSVRSDFSDLEFKAGRIRQFGEGVGLGSCGGLRGVDSWRDVSGFGSWRSFNSWHYRMI